jgi:hypothetical protein
MPRKALALAIAAGLGFAGFSTVAAAATPSTAEQTQSTTTELAQLQAQLAALQAKVTELEQRTDAQSDINIGTQQNLQALQSSAQPADADAASTKVGGTSYFDFTHLDQTRGGSKTAASGNGLDVKRFYLSVDHKFNDIWSANLTTDFNYVSADGETQLFVKKAYLQGTFDKLATLRVGSANMPWIPFVEDWYGYRFVEPTLTDRNKFGNSADWGVHLLGDNGVFDYQASIVNGGGYKNPTRSNAVDFEARAGFQPFKSMIIAVGGYRGDLGKDTTTTPALHDAHRYDAMLAYNANGLRLGAEYFKATNWNNVATPLADSANGASVWGSYDFGPAAVFARYDRLKPSKSITPGVTDTYWNLGVAFPLTKGVRLAVAYKNELLNNGSGADLKTRELGAWGELKF